MGVIILILVEIIVIVAICISCPAFVLATLIVPLSLLTSKLILPKYPKKYNVFTIPVFVSIGLFFLATILPSNLKREYKNYHQGTLIFTESFDDNHNNWPATKGIAMIKDGKYHIKGLEAPTYIYLQRNFSEFVFECKIQRRTALNKERFFGILFGDESYESFPNPEGIKLIMQYTNKKISDLSIYKEFLSRTEPHVVRIFCWRNFIKIYLNGVEYSSYSIKNGSTTRRIGFYVSGDGDEIEVDNVYVYSLIKEWWKF